MPWHDGRDSFSERNPPFNSWKASSQLHPNAETRHNLKPNHSDEASSDASPDDDLEDDLEDDSDDHLDFEIFEIPRPWGIYILAKWQIVLSTMAIFFIFVSIALNGRLFIKANPNIILRMAEVLLLSIAYLKVGRGMLQGDPRSWHMGVKLYVYNFITRLVWLILILLPGVNAAQVPFIKPGQSLNTMVARSVGSFIVLMYMHSPKVLNYFDHPVEKPITEFSKLFGWSLLIAASTLLIWWITTPN